jgi:hypothetical protein
MQYVRQRSRFIVREIDMGPSVPDNAVLAHVRR